MINFVYHLKNKFFWEVINFNYSFYILSIALAIVVGVSQSANLPPIVNVYRKDFFFNRMYDKEYLREPRS